MNELPEIYRRIEYLRNKGVKMKEIADHTNMAASVLSSLYSSVLPTYIGCIKKGNNEEEALDYALSQVNNVSKKHLLGNLKELKEQFVCTGACGCHRTERESVSGHAVGRDAPFRTRRI
mgnify:CR=1 FL=1